MRDQGSQMRDQGSYVRDHVSQVREQTPQGFYSHLPYDGGAAESDAQVARLQCSECLWLFISLDDSDPRGWQASLQFTVTPHPLGVQPEVCSLLPSMGCAWASLGWGIPRGLKGMESRVPNPLGLMSGSPPLSWVPLLLPITPVTYLPGPAARLQHLESSWSPLWGLSFLPGCTHSICSWRAVCLQPPWCTYCHRSPITASQEVRSVAPSRSVGKVIFTTCFFSLKRQVCYFGLWLDSLSYHLTGGHSLLWNLTWGLSSCSGPPGASQSPAQGLQEDPPCAHVGRGSITV